MATDGKAARQLSNDVLARWLIEAFPYRIQLAHVFPFYGLAGHELRYANTGPLALGGGVGFEGSIPDKTRSPLHPGRVAGLAELATGFRIPYASQDVFSSDVNDQTAVQMALAIRELVYQFWRLFEAGDGTASDGREFDGLDRLVDPSNVIDLKGAALTLEALDLAKDRVRANDGRGAVAFTSGIGKRAIHAAHWVRALAPQYEEHSFPSPSAGTRAEKVLTFDGAPVFVNDLNRTETPGSGSGCGPLSPEEARTADGFDPALSTSIWFMVLGEEQLHGLYPAALGDSMFVTRSTIHPDGVSTAYHVTMPVGLALGNASALAVVRNATIPGDPAALCG